MSAANRLCMSRQTDTFADHFCKQMNNDTSYHTLPNGLQIVHRPTTSPVAYVGIMVGTGTRYEQPQENGMAHYIEHCVFKGTQHYTARQIINHIEGMGGEINAYTTKEETTFYAATLRQHWRTTLHLIADMVLHPTFPKKETDKELTVIFDEIESYNDSPSELIYDDFEGLIFQGNPLAMPILGNKKTLRHIASSSQYPYLWMQKHYRPERMVLFVLGDINTQQIIHYAERLFSDVVTPNATPVSITPPADITTPQQALFRRHTHQTHLMLGAHAYPIGHPKQLAMYLLNNILGGGSMSSRLNLALREKRGLVYTIESQYTPLSDTGYWNIYLACEPQHKQQCVDLCIHELQQLRQTTLTTTQFQHALQQIEGQMAISAENNENNALAMAKSTLYHHYAPIWQETFQQLQQLTPQQLQEVADEVYNEKCICLLQYD